MKWKTGRGKNLVSDEGDRVDDVTGRSHWPLQPLVRRLVAIETDCYHDATIHAVSAASCRDNHNLPVHRVTDPATFGTDFSTNFVNFLGNDTLEPHQLVGK